MLRPLLVVTGTILAGVTIFAAPVEGQEEETCTFCSYSVGEHSFSEFTCTDEDQGCWGCEDTPEGHIGCHSFRWPGECGEGHTECGGGANEEDMDEDMEQLTVAIAAGNDVEVARIVTTNPAIYLNSQRNAVQALSCTGAVSDHIAVDQSFATKIAVTSRAIQYLNTGAK